MRFRRLHPDPAEVDVAEQFAAFRPQELAPPGRPYVIANFVVSADGRAAFHGRSKPLGDDGDREVFLRLRTVADAVLAGTGTMRVERYGPLVRRAERVEERRRRGLRPAPLMVALTRSGDVPPPLLLDDPGSELVVYAGADTAGLDGRATVHVHRMDGPDPAGALADLRARHGVRALLCEGGPTLLGALLAAGLVDELFLTVAPALVGGGLDPPLAVGAPLQELRRLRLEWALERASSLFLRYRVAPA